MNRRMPAIVLIMSVMVAGCGRTTSEPPQRPTDHPVAESAVTPSPNPKPDLQTQQATISDPYMAQFIPYDQAMAAARVRKPGGSLHVFFTPEVSYEHQGTVEKIPTWIATEIGPMGNRIGFFGVYEGGLVTGEMVGPK